MSNMINTPTADIDLPSPSCLLRGYILRDVNPNEKLTNKCKYCKNRGLFATCVCNLIFVVWSNLHMYVCIHIYTVYYTDGM